MKNILILLFLFSISADISASDTLVIALNSKAKLKTDIDYEIIKQLNPDIENFDIIAGDFKNDKTSFRIGIYNENNNDKYDDLSDLVIISKYKNPHLDIREGKMCTNFRSNLIIESDSIQYEILKVEKIHNEHFLYLIPIEVNEKRPNISLIYKIPEFKLKLLSGDSTMFKFPTSNKFVFMFFWTSWCTYCHAQIPNLRQFYEQNKDKVIFIGVNDDEDLEKAKKYIETNKIDSWIHTTVTKDLINKTTFKGEYPYSIFISPKGEIIDFNISTDIIIKSL